MVAVEMHRVVFGGHNAGVLQHNLDGGAVSKPVSLGASARLPEASADVAGVVELQRRDRREVGGENTGKALVEGLHDGIGFGENEGDVVDAGGEAGAVGALAAGAVGVGAVDQA